MPRYRRDQGPQPHYPGFTMFCVIKNLEYCIPSFWKSFKHFLWCMRNRYQFTSQKAISDRYLDGAQNRTCWLYQPVAIGIQPAH